MAPYGLSGERKQRRNIGKDMSLLRETDTSSLMVLYSTRRRLDFHSEGIRKPLKSFEQRKI